MNGNLSDQQSSPLAAMADSSLRARRRRLLIISADFPPTKSAEADHAYHLGIQFARRGFDVTVLTTAAPRTIPEPPGVSVAAVMRRWNFASLPRFVAFLLRHQPDSILLLYLGTMYENHPMITFAPTVARRVVPRATFVTQFENLLVSDTKSKLTKAVRKVIRQWVTGAGTDYSYGTLLRDSQRIIVLSERHLDRLREHCADLDATSVLIPPAPIMRICRCENGLARRDGRKALGFAEDEIVFVYYGYIYPGKGVESMLEAFAIVSKRHPGARLLIIGGFVAHTLAAAFTSSSRSYETSVMELAASLEIEKNVRWAGHCPSTELEGSRYLWSSDICVLPFDWGVNLNNSSLAAAATHGLPILTTSGLSVDSPIVDGDNVLLCPPKDPVAMARAMERLVESPELRQRLATGARALAREWFDWDRVIERLTAALSAT